MQEGRWHTVPSELWRVPHAEQLITVEWHTVSSCLVLDLMEWNGGITESSIILTHHLSKLWRSQMGKSHLVHVPHWSHLLLHWCFVHVPIHHGLVVSIRYLELWFS